MIARPPASLHASSLGWAACVALASLVLCASARADSPHIEKLDPETAFAEVASTEGTVFVDLYAEW